MPRVVSIYLPKWPTDRIRRMGGAGAPPVEQPMVLINRVGSRRTVMAADAAAVKLGLRPGVAASKAQAMVAGLLMLDIDISGDAHALYRLAMWALAQFSPIVAVDGSDGLVLDTEGADHLRGGESMMVTEMFNRLHNNGVVSRVAVADTWGAAHAVARFTSAETTVVPRGETSKAIVGLPVAALIHGVFG
jgi:protein ImuB